jgi:hypothetical protein
MSWRKFLPTRRGRAWRRGTDCRGRRPRGTPRDGGAFGLPADSPSGTATNPAHFAVRVVGNLAKIDQPLTNLFGPSACRMWKERKVWPRFFGFARLGHWKLRDRGSRSISKSWQRRPRRLPWKSKLSGVKAKLSGRHGERKNAIIVDNNCILDGWPSGLRHRS